jgi:esterase/lipase superfamily enzyme
MSAARLSFLALAFTLLLAPPAAAQRHERISPDLVKALREVAVQRQLIASGSLDAVVGRASRFQLRNAIEWFRKAYRFQGGLGPFTKEERAKLADIYAQFEKATGLKEHAYDDPETGKRVKLRLPLAFVKATHTEGGGADKWREYRADDNSVSVGPVAYPVSKFTPIALFRERIMSEPLKYKYLHLTSDEFTALGEIGDDRTGYVSYNLVLSYGDELKGLFMRYAKRPPDGFTVPDFLQPIVDTEPLPGDAANVSETIRPDPRTRGWQLLLASVANLIASDFPFDNGWEKVSTKDCPLANEGEDGEPNVRIFFGTDRKLKPGAPRSGRVADPDSLFAAEGGGGLHLGCAYVSKAAAKSEAWADLVPDYKLVRESRKKGDIGDQIYLTDEIGETGTARADALVFIHGYNVPFKYALSTVGRLVAETGYEGRVYMYSWPSVQSTLGYIQDLDNAEQAEPFFQSFMRILMRDANIYNIDVLAHSMGSQTLLRAVSALRPIFETQRGVGTWARPIRIGQMIFAAPDVAMSVFDQKIHRIAPYARRVTVYASSNDTALLASKLLRGGVPRVGDLLDGEPILVDLDNVHIVDATGKERWYRLDRAFTGYGHDYFSQDPAVLADIREILMAPRGDDQKTPDERSKDRFEVKHYKSAPERTYWKLRDK